MLSHRCAYSKQDNNSYNIILNKDLFILSKSDLYKISGCEISAKLSGSNLPSINITSIETDKILDLVYAGTNSQGLLILDKDLNPVKSFSQFIPEPKNGCNQKDFIYGTMGGFSTISSLPSVLDGDSSTMKYLGFYKREEYVVRVIASGDYIAARSANYIDIISVLDPFNPRLVANLNISSAYHYFCGDLLFISGLEINTINIYRINFEEKRIEDIGRYNSTLNGRPELVKDNILVIGAYNNGGVELVDISNVKDMRQIFYLSGGSYPLDYIQSAISCGIYICVADEFYGIKLIDISDRENIRILASAEGMGNRVITSHDSLILSYYRPGYNGNYTINIYDVESGSLNIIASQTIDTAFASGRVRLLKDDLIIISTNTGVAVYDAKNRTNIIPYRNNIDNGVKMVKDMRLVKNRLVIRSDMTTEIIEILNDGIKSVKRLNEKAGFDITSSTSDNYVAWRTGDKSIKILNTDSLITTEMNFQDDIVSASLLYPFLYVISSDSRLLRFNILTGDLISDIYSKSITINSRLYLDNNVLHITLFDNNMNKMVKSIDLNKNWSLNGIADTAGEFKISIFVNGELKEISINVIDTGITDIGILIICASLIISSIILFILAKAKARNSSPSIIIVFGITVSDLITDIMFIVWIRSESPSLFYLSLLCLIIYIFLSLSASFFILRREMQVREFNTWYKKNRTVSTFAFALSSFNVNLLNFLTSSILNLKCFNAPLRAKTRKYLNLFSLLSVFFEDVPQLIFQITAVTIGEFRISSMIWISIFISAISLLFAVSKRAALYLESEADSISKKEIPMKEINISNIEL